MKNKSEHKFYVFFVAKIIFWNIWTISINWVHTNQGLAFLLEFQIIIDKMLESDHKFWGGFISVFWLFILFYPLFFLPKDLRSSKEKIAPKRLLHLKDIKE